MSRLLAPLAVAAAAVFLVSACSGPSGAGPSDARAPADSTRADTATHGDATADAAGSGSGTDPASNGPLAVTTTVVSIPGTGSDIVPATVYAPTGGASPRPLVVISPGFQLARTQYASYAQHLATWGFVVVLTDYADQSIFADHQTMANDVGKVIDWALAQSALAVDATKIATAGHSLGGDISVLAAVGDARITAVVGWDPVDGSSPAVIGEMTHLTAAIAVAGETTDGSGAFACAPTADDYAAFYAASPSPALAITIAGASHMNWVDDPGCAVCGLCTAGTADPDAVHAITRRLNVAWLRLRLLGDTSMTAWLVAPSGTTEVSK